MASKIWPSGKTSQPSNAVDTDLFCSHNELGDTMQIASIHECHRIHAMLEAFIQELLRMKSPAVKRAAGQKMDGDDGCGHEILLS